MTASPPSLGARIRRARERAKLSQEELAKAVGASVRAVGDWENDRRKPRNRLGALEEVLGVSLDGEPDPDPYPHVPPDVAAYVRRRWRRDPGEVAAVLADLEEVFSPRPAREQPPGEGGRESRRAV